METVLIPVVGPATSTKKFHLIIRGHPETGDEGADRQPLPRVKLLTPLPHRRLPSHRVPASYSVPALLALALALGAGPVAAQAASSANSRAYGVAFTASAGPAQLSVAPTPDVVGSAPPAYNLNQSVAQVTASSAPLGTLLSTAAVTASAASAEPNQDQASANAAVHDLVAFSGGLVSLQATEIDSAATLSGTCGSSLSATGDTLLVGARLVVGGITPATIDLVGKPAPNTVAFDGLGVRVVLNEQTLASGATHGNASVNAIHVYVLGLQVGANAINADLVISHSEAAIACSSGGGSQESADLGVTMQGNPSRVQPGDHLTYTISVTNAGPGAPQQVLAVDTLPPPPSVTLLGATPSQGTCSGTAVVTCQLGALIPGGGAIITIEVMVGSNPPSTLTNTVAVSSELPDNNPSNNVAVVVTPVDQSQCPSAPSSSATVALGKGRFLVNANWRNPGARATPAQGLALSDAAAYFWFVDSQRVDLVVQVEDACATTGTFHVSVLGATQLPARVRVVDTATGAVWTSVHTQGAKPFQPSTGELACGSP